MNEMPKTGEILHPYLRAIANGARNTREALPELRRHFALTDAQMEEMIPSGGRAKIFDRADWAGLWLQQAGLTKKIARAHNVITDSGREALASGNVIDQKFVRNQPTYIAWKKETAERRARNAQTADESDIVDDTQTPSEMIDAAWHELDTALIEELLEQVLTFTPAQFERLIVDLLIAMGYGDGRAEMGRAIGKSGDGGIDGVVNEDKLGLDAVYIQAKRYAPENTVGRPDVQGFVGSMTGESATKGVFVTTSRFSSGARDYVRMISQRVVLIDGARLARLMIDHGVGVVVEKTYTLHKIDENFFGGMDSP